MTTINIFPSKIKHICVLIHNLYRKTVQNLCFRFIEAYFWKNISRFCMENFVPLVSCYFKFKHFLNNFKSIIWKYIVNFVLEIIIVFISIPTYEYYYLLWTKCNLKLLVFKLKSNTINYRYIKKVKHMNIVSINFPSLKWNKKDVLFDDFFKEFSRFLLKETKNNL